MGPFFGRDYWSTTRPNQVDHVDDLSGRDQDEISAELRMRGLMAPAEPTDQEYWAHFNRLAQRPGGLGIIGTAAMAGGVEQSARADRDARDKALDAQLKKEEEQRKNQQRQALFLDLARQFMTPRRRGV